MLDADFRATVEAMLGKPIQDWQWRVMEHLLGGNAEESESQVAPGVLASEERLASSASPKPMGQPIKTSASDDADDRQPPQANEAAPPISPGALCSPTYDRQPFD